MKLEKTPFLATHLSGDVAWIDVLFVPREQRHQGYGRRMFCEWMAKLPATVKKIQLLAVDLDGGSPVGFWRKLGFDVEEAYFPELMTGCYMVQPLHGGPPSASEQPSRQGPDRSGDEVWCVPA
jgi:hypothetical protein